MNSERIAKLNLNADSFGNFLLPKIFNTASRMFRSDKIQENAVVCEEYNTEKIIMKNK